MMTREQIKEHYADVVMSVFMAESEVKPDLQERVKALGDNPTPEQKAEMSHQYSLDVAEEILYRTTDEELNKLYKD